MKLLKILQIILILTLLSIMSYFGYMTYKEAKVYEEKTSQIAKMSDAHGLASEKIDALTSAISLGLVKNETKEKLTKLQHMKKQANRKSKNYFYYFLLTLGGIILLSFTCSLRGAAMTLSFSTFIALIYGLINPILMVTIHKNVEYLGDVILSFESKGIIGSISKLFDSGEIAVALTILLFSVTLPLLKSLTLTFTLLFYDKSWSIKLVNFFKHLGKWSMLDVFVVATFLVYITTNGGEMTHAEIQVGLYFFLIYVILSMIVALLTQKVLLHKARKIGSIGSKKKMELFT